MRRFSGAILAIAACSISLSGCSSTEEATVPVRPTVKALDDKPLPGEGTFVIDLNHDLTWSQFGLDGKIEGFGDLVRPATPFPVELKFRDGKTLTINADSVSPRDDYPDHGHGPDDIDAVWVRSEGLTEDEMRDALKYAQAAVDADIDPYLGQYYDAEQGADVDGFDTRHITPEIEPNLRISPSMDSKGEPIDITYVVEW